LEPRHAPKAASRRRNNTARIRWILDRPQTTALLVVSSLYPVDRGEDAVRTAAVVIVDARKEGATAFRNARGLAQHHCDELIQRANAKALRVDGGPEIGTRRPEIRT
jgi:hypothetical protein